MHQPSYGKESQPPFLWEVGVGQRAHAQSIIPERVSTTLPLGGGCGERVSGTRIFTGLPQAFCVTPQKCGEFSQDFQKDFEKIPYLTVNERIVKCVTPVFGKEVESINGFPRKVHFKLNHRGKTGKHFQDRRVDLGPTSVESFGIERKVNKSAGNRIRSQVLHKFFGRGDQIDSKRKEI